MYVASFYWSLSRLCAFVCVEDLQEKDGNHWRWWQDVLRLINHWVAAATLFVPYTVKCVFITQFTEHVDMGTVFLKGAQHLYYDVFV